MTGYPCHDNYFVNMLQVSSESLPEGRSVTEAATVTRPIRCRRCQQVLPDQRPLSTMSIPTDQSAVVEVEVDEQKELDSKSVQTEVEVSAQKELSWQVTIREQMKEMKEYIQMLRGQLEQRSNEAVVIAARLREAEMSQLLEIRRPQNPPSTAQQPDDEPAYKSKHFCVYIYVYTVGHRTRNRLIIVRNLVKNQRILMSCHCSVQK